MGHMVEASDDFLLVVLGDVASTHLHVIEQMPGSEVVAGVDLEANAGLTFRGRPLPVYRSRREAAANHRIDSVVIATPTPTHAQCLRGALRCQADGHDLDALTVTTWQVTDPAKTTRIRYGSGAELVMDHTAVAGYLVIGGNVAEVFGADASIPQRERHYRALYRSWLSDNRPIATAQGHLFLHGLLLKDVDHVHARVSELFAGPGACGHSSIPMGGDNSRPSCIRAAHLGAIALRMGRNKAFIRSPYDPAYFSVKSDTAAFIHIADTPCRLRACRPRQVQIGLFRPSAGPVLKDQRSCRPSGRIRVRMIALALPGVFRKGPLVWTCGPGWA